MWWFWNQQPCFLATCLPALPNWCNVLCCTMNGVSALWANCSLWFVSCTCLHSKFEGAMQHKALAFAIAITQNLSAIYMSHAFYRYGQPAHRFGMSTKRLLNRLPQGEQLKAQNISDATLLVNMCAAACIWGGLLIEEQVWYLSWCDALAILIRNYIYCNAAAATTIQITTWLTCWKKGQSATGLANEVLCKVNWHV